MDNIDMNVSLSPHQAADIVTSAVTQGSLSAELVDSYTADGNGVTCVTLVFDKYFMRNSSRASLSVTIENLKGFTHVHAAGSGGGQGALWNFDWGAGSRFTRDVADALAQYQL